MKLNFKYYTAKSLLLLLVGSYILSLALKEKLGYLIVFPESLEKILALLGWLKPMMVISFVLFLINKYLWKYPWMRWLIDIPNLNGRYVGELTSSFTGPDGQQVKKDCVIEIKQDASGIHVSTYYADKGTKVQTSKAGSIAEEIIKEKKGIFSLLYIFSNEPDGMLEALNKHDGTAKFAYLADKKELAGEYYNHRLNKGTIRVAFEGKKRLHRFAP